MHVADVDLRLTSPSQTKSVFFLSWILRLTVHTLDVVLSVRRRYHLIYMNFISTQRAAKQSNKHTVKYTKYIFAYCRPLIADILLMGGAIRQHCASCHVTAISYVYSTRKMSSFFRISYILNALIFSNISSASDSVDSVLIII